LQWVVESHGLVPWIVRFVSTGEEKAFLSPPPCRNEREAPRDKPVASLKSHGLVLWIVRFVSTGGKKQKPTPL
jgi:hypothetical protein